MSLGKKKVLMSLTASAVVAGSFALAEEVKASSYKVQSGDTLWSIAQKHSMSIAQLKSLNNLSNDFIIPNQVIKVASSETVVSNKNDTPSLTEKKSSNKTTYKVKAGDSLSRIAKLHNISINDLIKWNNLDSTIIYPGNVLTVSKSNSNLPNTTNSQQVKNNTNQTTYTVKSGDTLSKIAKQYKTTVSNLKKWNNLNSDFIRVGQKLNVQSNKDSSVKGNQSSSEQSNDTPSTTTSYIVKSGDTLSRIAKTHKVTVNNLREWNNLSSDAIYIGQKLNINGNSEPNNSINTTENNTPTDINYDVNRLINGAKQAIGTKYTWGGQTLNGFDCSGFIHWAYNGAGMNMNRLSTDGYYNRSYYVNNPKVGDLVFFKDTYRSGISHAGIYIGNNEFIHAGTSTGVTISSLNNPYWEKHYDGFKRFY